MEIILVILFFLLLSAFFSGAEIAFISANKLGVELKKSSGSRKGRIISDFYKKSDHFLGVMLIGNNIALVAFTYFMTRLLEDLLGPGFHASTFLLLITTTVIITGVVLVFGEFLPKTIFRLYSNQILFYSAYILNFFNKILSPLSWMVIKMSNLLLRYIFRQNTREQESTFTRHDLERFVSGESAGANDQLDTDLFRNALNLKDIRVRDCMIPRTEIKYVESSAELAEITSVFRKSGHSRILVVDGDIDHVIGYIHHQSLFNKKGGVKKMLMDILIVPEVLNIKDLLLKFVRDRIYIACVVDEYGGTSGLITLEDILEELFGEIEDEHDQEDLIEKQIGEKEFLFSGRMEIDYLNENYQEINLPEGDYLTLSGYLIEALGSIPEKGVSIELDGYKFTTELVTEKKIETVKVELL